MSSKMYGREFLKGISKLRVAPVVTTRAIEEFYQSLDCPRALTCWMLFQNGEHEQLAKLDFDPLNYLTMVDCRDAYAATKFLSKYKDLTLDYDLDEVALQKFKQFELLCKQTNNRFRHLSSDPLYTSRVARLHIAVGRKIGKLLGDFSADEFFSMPDWGPGATTSVKRRQASPAKKFQCETGITRDLHSLLPLAVLGEKYPAWAYHLSRVNYPRFEVGNKVVTVAKDATTNRVIAIEPGINSFFQLSVGKMISRRLLRYGIDLRNQRRNQELAKVGSETGLLATIDMSSASDSIAVKVVEDLFSNPEVDPRWLAIMDACRCHFGELDAQQVRWEKFSSMGNGFTFPLESLIFFAVAKCCAEYLHVVDKDVSVYGDDIIIPKTCLTLFSEMMAFYGFQINLKKSHYNSTFRESCGRHYFSGVDVTPIYLKGKLTNVPSVYRLANAIRRLAHRRNNSFGCDNKLQRVFEHLVQAVPKPMRFGIPEGYGDGGFIMCFDEATPSRMRNFIEGYSFYHLAEIGKTYQFVEVGLLFAQLWQMPTYDLLEAEKLLVDREGRAMLETINHLFPVKDRESRNSVALKALKRLKVVKSIARQWYHLGQWL